jgi:mRNA-degrading endonuclease toxin of MazEF toxin-antitoxin module
MAASVKRTYNLDPRTVRRVREMAEQYGVAPSQDAVIELAVDVSYEPFHRSGLATVCPITATRSEPRYPGDVAIPLDEAGQTKDGVILTSQVRTISLRRVRSTPVGVLRDRRIRRAVRSALAHHLGLDIPALADGAG